MKTPQVVSRSEVNILARVDPEARSYPPGPRFGFGQNAFFQPAIIKTEHPEIKCARNKTKNPKTN